MTLLFYKLFNFFNSTRYETRIHFLTVCNSKLFINDVVNDWSKLFASVRGSLSPEYFVRRGNS